MQVPFSYLDRQFAEIDDYLEDVRALVASADFTLGTPVAEFERRFAELCQLPFAVGVGSGTDALLLALKGLGIGPGDEVITSPNTFIATVGAIAMTGARPVFADNDKSYTIDPAQITRAITSRTRAILPVHYSGNVADMEAIAKIAAEHELFLVEDACQAITGERDGHPVGYWGEAVCFSLHPLKNLNVWGDGGVVVTRSSELDARLRLLRNHGLINRDEAQIFGHNSRLDSLQAVIANRLLEQTEFITGRRIENAERLDEGLSDLQDFIAIPPRLPNVKHVYHLYIVRAQRRDALMAHLNTHGVEAKVHYPIPVHLQTAARSLGYQKGDFPVAEQDSQTMISLPAHQHLGDSEVDYVIEQVRDFYRNG